MIAALLTAGALTVFAALAMLRRIEAGIDARTGEAKIANELTRRQAELEAFRRMQTVRAEHAARDHGRHHGHGHTSHCHGNASMPGAAE